MDVTRLITEIHKYISDALSPLATRVKALEDVPTPEPAKDGEKGEPGDKGADGSSVTVDDVLPSLKEHVDKFLGAVELPAAVTADEVAAALEGRFKGMFSDWALGFERMANDRVERFLEAIPKPKDGRDALQVEDFNLSISDDGRVATVTLKAGDRVIEKSIRLSTLVDKGIFVADSDYEKGDGVTWGGSFFIATKDLPKGNPGEPGCDGWRLAVKRGRDGRNGRDGIDMTKPVTVSVK